MPSREIQECLDKSSEYASQASASNSLGWAGSYMDMARYWLDRAAFAARMDITPFPENVDDRWTGPTA